MITTTLLALIVGCAHTNKIQTGAKPPEVSYLDLSAVPIGPCALVAVYGTPGYSRPVESAKYELVRLNWGAFPVIVDPALGVNGWMAIATEFGGEVGDRRRVAVYVRASNMTFDMRQSTMSPGDVAETDWSLCSNGPTGR